MCTRCLTISHIRLHVCCCCRRRRLCVCLLCVFAFVFLVRTTVPKLTLPAARHRLTSEANFADTEVDELIAMLRETENLEEQGDILQYLVDTQGLDFDTGMCDECGAVVPWSFLFVPIRDYVEFGSINSPIVAFSAHESHRRCQLPID